MSEKNQITHTAEKVSKMMQTNYFIEDYECRIKKTRTFNILTNQTFLTCTLEQTISFEYLTDCGHACNKAEVFLLPEELPAFSFTLKEHAIPLPAGCLQKLTSTYRLISYYIETQEPPEHFASRLSAAFKIIEPLKNHALSLH